MLLASLTRQSTFDEVAAAIIGESQHRGYTRDESIACLSTGIQESGLRPTAVSLNGLWHGIYQQDTSYPGRDDPHENIQAFLDRLDVKRRSPGASPDIWLNIFWLQQRPGEPSSDAAYRNGRQAYLTEIKRHTARAGELYDRFSASTPTGGSGVKPNPGWRGDPTFLLEVLRAEGLEVHELEGARDRGHGDFDAIWGIVAHHTGDDNASAQSIAFHPELGLCSQLHLAQDGTVTICGVGIAWHAGPGSWPGIPEDGANQITIGIEAANDGGGSPGRPHRSCWPDTQYDAYVKTCAAILRFLGHRADRVIAHKEWAGAKQGKWDPGGIDMQIFREDVQRQIDRAPTPTPPPPPPGKPTPVGPADDQLTLRWNMLGGQTVVEALAEIRDKLCGTNDAEKIGVH